MCHRCARAQRAHFLAPKNEPRISAAEAGTRGSFRASYQNRTDDLFITSEVITKDPAGALACAWSRKLDDFLGSSIHGLPRRSPFKVCPKVCPSASTPRSDTCALPWRIGHTMERDERNEKTTWLTRREAAEHLRLSPATLANWASLECGPAYFRIGRGRVLYRLVDVESWLSVQSGLAS